MTCIIAHRGARSLAPENTLAAAKKAWHLGAHAWETDVQITRDGHPVLFHDKDLLRCTDARTRLTDLTSEDQRQYLLSAFSWAELQTLDAGSWFEAADPFSTIRNATIDTGELAGFRNEKIPTLAQGLALTQSLDWQVNLELKDYGTDPRLFYTVDTTLAVIRQSRISLHQVILSSFNHDWLDRVRQQAPDICIQALVGNHGHRYDPDSLRAGFRAYNLNAGLVDPAFVSRLVRQGFQINLFTVNDPGIAARFIRAGAGGIITDFPQFF
ncbi:MAG: glycerophosphodiester phosphodiesterase family protein [Desulfotignum sp.]|nr:glycerophosphodiester phosphodiesterase family protein [Desulfotignum sp.]